jgi:carbamoyl-phosphate synthase/aspartate carbamoyltransferase/dihydroorotase
LFIKYSYFEMNNTRKCILRFKPKIYFISPINTNSNILLRLPGLIDTHTHVREPGEPYKEDWKSLTKAALAGGFTMIGVMPNTNPPAVDKQSFNNIQNIAAEKVCCDYALHVGATSTNYDQIHELGKNAAGLKLYLNNTFGPLLLDDVEYWKKHIINWHNNVPDRPIAAHAELDNNVLEDLLLLCGCHDIPIHICHVARKREIELIKQCKEMGAKVTCEVTPHHLFLDNANCCCHSVKPPIVTPEDRDALWENIDLIDCFATDHAPHLKENKQRGFCPGYPGLETALPLLLTAVKDPTNKLTLEDIKKKCYTNPKKIYNLPTQPNTFVEIDLDEEWIIPEKMPYTKADWTPFAGRKVCGRVKNVVLRGKQVVRNGEVIIGANYGQDVRQY